jgi:DNA-directed RNA polymerase subunit RPC12/RpoP
MPETITGLACPSCQGRLEIPEGTRIVVCPYCSQRSLVRGVRGVYRYQVPRRVDRDRALGSLRSFLHGLNRAPDLASKARLTELFTAYLPFWSVWAKVAGWVLGEQRVGSGDRRRYEPREVKVQRPMNWNAAACDVAEFGVEAVRLEGRAMEPFQPSALHADGMVFEPVGSVTEGERLAQQVFEAEVRAASRLDRIGSIYTRLLGKRLGLVYFPLWVARYLYRGRAYQVVIDGHSGEVLYGKAPGNTWFRAAALVGGMAAGALLMVDGTALALSLLSGSDEGSLVFLLVPVLAGAALMVAGYRAFRYGEQIEQRARVGRKRASPPGEIGGLLEEIGVKVDL